MTATTAAAAELAELKKANERLNHLLNLTERQLESVAAQRDEWQQHCRFWRQRYMDARAEARPVSA